MCAKLEFAFISIGVLHINFQLTVGTGVNGKMRRRCSATKDWLERMDMKPVIMLAPSLAQEAANHNAVPAIGRSSPGELRIAFLVAVVVVGQFLARGVFNGEPAIKQKA